MTRDESIVRAGYHEVNFAEYELRDGGGGYPPDCAEVLSIAPLPSVQPIDAVADGIRVAETPSRELGRLPLTVISEHDDHATVRVADSRKTVAMVKRGGRWLIATVHLAR